MGLGVFQHNFIYKNRPLFGGHSLLSPELADKILNKQMQILSYAQIVPRYINLVGTNSLFKTSVIAELSLECYQINQKITDIIQISKINPVLLKNKLFLILDFINQMSSKSQLTNDQNKDN